MKWYVLSYIVWRLTLRSSHLGRLYWFSLYLHDFYNNKNLSQLVLGCHNSFRCLHLQMAVFMSTQDVGWYKLITSPLAHVCRVSVWQWYTCSNNITSWEHTHLGKRVVSTLQLGKTREMRAKHRGWCWTGCQDSESKNGSASRGWSRILLSADVRTVSQKWECEWRLKQDVGQMWKVETQKVVEAKNGHGSRWSIVDVQCTSFTVKVVFLRQIMKPTPFQSCFLPSKNSCLVDWWKHSAFSDQHRVHPGAGFASKQSLLHQHDGYGF